MAGVRGAGLVLVLVALAAGCDASGDDDMPTIDAGEAPVAKPRPQDAKPPPVGDGEGGVVLAKLGDFDQPVYVTQPPSGDRGHVYVVERCGTVRRVPVGGGEPTAFLDISDLVTCEGTEQGLLSVAFAPDYERSRLLYVYYTDSAQFQAVFEYRATADGSAVDPESARELLVMEDFATNHNGGLLRFGPDDLLWIGTGDGGGADDPERTGQDLTQLLGKILRIDPRPDGGEPYGIPRDNPHLDVPGARPEIAVNGMRNPWRFSFDRKTGDLWIGDVGQSELEEIDAATFTEVIGRGSGSGLNFGWSAFEGSARFNEDQQAPGARPPVHEYGRDAGCSVTGGHVVRDPALRSLYGRYLYGDYCAEELRSFTARVGGQADDDRPLGVQVSDLSSFGEDSAGRIYAASLEGPVYRLVAQEDE